MREFIPIVEAAGRAILAIYETAFAVRHKDDCSPVTEADHAAEAIIVQALGEMAPDIPTIAEEATQLTGLPTQAPDRFWLVDPLDGTKEFLKRNGEFTVNIGLVEDCRATAGIIHIPVSQETFWTEGGQAWRARPNERPLPVEARQLPQAGATLLGSRSHGGDEIAALFGPLKIAERKAAGSSLKFCRLAEGAADLYPRLKPTMEWDSAAGQAILEAAKGSVRLLDGSPLRYGKPGFLNPNFIARGREP
ncbi:MAG TPA: 3'(2'),5'-bisphosphate nucleotidase CysQ [Dongiaceae bacterium]|jgi:3'(2'), 5'-bisphosphate nucleotidase|nr:3'(2'),5'-bisphosphate nucleotidase CysQ [Dongiaceae bacterium]